MGYGREKREKETKMFWSKRGGNKETDGPKGINGISSEDLYHLTD